MKSISKMILGLVASVMLASPAMADTTERDKKAEELLNKLMPALQITDFEASVKATMPLLHKSLINNTGSDVTADLRRFSFKKAHENSSGYATPVKITRVRETTTSAIGFGPTAEAGKVVDYFISKKDGIGGLPAPVKIFFPADGSEPKVSYLGSI